MVDRSAVSGAFFRLSPGLAPRAENRAAAARLVIGHLAMGGWGIGPLRTCRHCEAGNRSLSYARLQWSLKYATPLRGWRIGRLAAHPLRGGQSVTQLWAAASMREMILGAMMLSFELRVWHTDDRTTR